MTEKLKYKINELIGDLPKSMTIGRIETILRTEHKISRDTFYRDRYLKVDDDYSIPSDRLDVYAALLNKTSGDQLKNFAVKKIKPLVDRKPSKLMTQIMKRTNLKRK